jgi:nucleotide-binding universal stress UspA family protein
MARLDGPGRANVSVTLVRGRAAVEIDRYARESRAGLVVMTTHGHGPLSRAWLGSVADQLVRAAPAPILLVRPSDEERPDLAARPAFRRILVPLDGSDAAEEVLDLAVPLGALWDAAYTLVRVVPLYVQVGSPYMAHALHLDQALMEAARAEAESYLKEVSARLAKRELDVTPRLAEGAAAQVILALADEERADLVAMRARGRGGIERLVLGSVADKVIRGLHRPVLVQTIRE